MKLQEMMNNIPNQGVCPHCGYCPICGRQYLNPWSQQPFYWNGTTYVGNTSGLQNAQATVNQEVKTEGEVK